MAGYSGEVANWPSIPEFYSHKDVLITGATGFMGKCLVEKLLRSIPDIGRLYLLVRPKRGKMMEERIESLLQSKLFDSLRHSNPKVFKKLVPVAGDIGQPSLGLSEDDQQLLIDNVSVVFHLAATIRFDAPLRESLQLNVIGVMELVKLCRRFKKLASYVHVSTAYAHCNREGVIEETVYPPQVSPQNLIQLLDWMDDRQLDLLTPSLLEGRPNMYTFTKALAEYLLINEAKGLPLAIYRPSIVGGAYREPYPGWVDCIHGPSSLFVAVGQGMLRVLKYKSLGVADIVPVDLVNNMLISVGWITGVNQTTHPIVYQFTSGSTNPVNWKTVNSYMVNAYTAIPFDQPMRRPMVIKCRPVSFWPYWDFLIHWVPCFLMDILLRFTGRKPKMIRLYWKMNDALDKLDYFTQNDWHWSNTNCERLLSLMRSEDRKMFNFDLRDLDWEEYINIFCMGTKRYLLKEDMANLPRARQQMKRLLALRIAFRTMVVLLSATLVYQRSRIARKLWNSALHLFILWSSKIGPNTLRVWS